VPFERAPFCIGGTVVIVIVVVVVIVVDVVVVVVASLARYLFWISEGSRLLTSGSFAAPDGLEVKVSGATAAFSTSVNIRGVTGKTGASGVGVGIVVVVVIVVATVSSTRSVTVTVVATTLSAVVFASLVLSDVTRP
jgi:hypothetical protein